MNTGSCIQTIELLRRLALNVHGVIDAVDDRNCDEIISLLKEQETEWEHLWDAPDGTFKGRCKKCGFVHFFIEGHNAQYKFCPECGKVVKWD